MNFSSISNITLSDSISGYITANEDEDSDNTHYLSVLSQDIPLGEMNITLSNAEVDDNDETHIVELASEDVGQPLIFTINGSDEIYGVQIVRDEEGNLRKYQMQYTENMNGELVPMLETIQILSLDDEVQTKTHETEETIQIRANDQEVNNDQEECTHIKQGKEISGQGHEEFHLDTSENIECRPVTSSCSTACQRIQVKQETADFFDENSRNEPENENPDNCVTEQIHEEFHIEHVNLKMENIPDALVQIEMNEMENSIELEEQDQVRENTGAQHFEQLFVEENHIIANNQRVEIENMNENDSDNEMYHIVNGMHITGDVENDNCLEQPIQTILKETVDHHTKTNILKKPAQRSILRDQTGLDQKIIYVQALPEKENMEILDVERLPKPNSRSLLKCNQPPLPLVIPDPLHIVVAEDKFSKRYSRTKEAKQARQFMNFINSTTIPQVPERKERLPRKQQIKPVKHPNEDIVVKEMIVSSSGFVEPISAEKKKYLPVTEYVELLDSGDECNSTGTKKKKKAKRHEGPIEIEISDSEESNVSVIELDTQINDIDEDTKSKGRITKKKRGRPPKNINTENDKKDSDSNSESPPKIIRTDSDVDSVTSSFEVIRVENEAKGLNSSRKSAAMNSSQEISTTTNTSPVVKIVQDCSGINDIEYCIQDSNSPESSYQTEIHTEQTGISNEIPSSKLPNEVSKIKKPLKDLTILPKRFEHKHECEKCKTKFINKFLLTRHDCIVKSGLPFSCEACQKKFPNITSLNVHKKIHVKGLPVVKSGIAKAPQDTSAAKTAPNASGAIYKCPVKVSGTLLKNSTRESNLTKSSVRASTASAPVKPPPRHSMIPKTAIKASGAIPKNPLMPSLAASKSGSSKFLKPPSPAAAVTPDKTAKTNVFKFEKQCEKCPLRFENNASWFDHQVLKHGFKTPDKSIGEKKPKKLVRSAVAHTGISAAPLLAKNFLMLRSKMQQLQ